MAAIGAVVAVVVVIATAFSGGGSKPHAAVDRKLPVGPPGTTAAGVLRLGFVTDVADAPAVIGSQTGLLQRALGGVHLETDPFTSTASEEAALAGGQLDAAYLDPVTVAELSQQAHLGLTIVAGAASGGTEFVVRKGITRVSELRKRMLVAPPGGVLQVAADAWLHGNGMKPLTRDEAAPSTDAGVLHAFRSGTIAGGWEPAPLDVEMTSAGGHVFGASPDTSPIPVLVLVTTDAFLRSHPAAVGGLIEGEIQADHLLAADRVSAEAAFQQGIAAAEHSGLPPGVLARSFAQVTFTDRPAVGQITEEIREAAAAGLIRPVADPARLFGLRELDAVTG
jgi:NitT/TauT family transport system substrate-binding protein